MTPLPSDGLPVVESTGSQKVAQIPLHAIEPVRSLDRWYSVSPFEFTRIVEPSEALCALPRIGPAASATATPPAKSTKPARMVADRLRIRISEEPGERFGQVMLTLGRTGFSTKEQATD